MKSLLLVACLAALLSWSAAYPVIRLERVPFAQRVSIPKAVRICGWNPRCLLNQEIIGIENEEVRREYNVIVQLAFLKELSGELGQPDESPEAPSSDSSNSSEEEPEVTPPVMHVPDDSELESRPDPDAAPATRFHQVAMIAIRTPFGIRRVIIIRPVTIVADPDENVDTPVMVDHPDSPDETPAAPDSSDEHESRHIPIVPNESRHDQPDDDVADRSNVTPAPPASPEVTTDLNNSIEQNSRRSTTEPSEEDWRESLGDSSEVVDQVEVFDPKKPARITGEDRFRYKTETPEIRQI